MCAIIGLPEYTEHLVIENNGKYYYEGKSDDGPEPYTIRGWTDNIHKAKRFMDWRYDGKPQEYVHESVFKMPFSAKVLLVSVTETIESLEGVNGHRKITDDEKRVAIATKNRIFMQKRWKDKT